MLVLNVLYLITRGALRLPIIHDSNPHPILFRKSCRPGLPFVAILFLLLAPPLFASPDEVHDYRLVVGDQIRLKIGQWNAVDSVYENWQGLEGEYIVNPSGSVSIPIAGFIPAAGSTVADLSSEISARIQSEIGMPAPPAISIEITLFRPIYILGAVNDPGEYQYRPQMTVVQAISLAGGYFRATQSLNNSLAASRDYEILRLRRLSAIARLARLDAELANSDQIKMPQELENVSNSKELLAIEEAILSSHIEAHKSSKAALADLKKLLSARIEALAKETAIRKHQLELARKDLERQEKAVKKGLTKASTLTSASKAVSELEAKLLDLENETLSAEQKLNEAVREELELVNQRRLLIATESGETRQELDQLNIRLSAARALLATSLTGAQGSAEPERDIKPTFILMRRINGKMTSLEVGENAHVKPGDTLKIILDDPSSISENAVESETDTVVGTHPTSPVQSPPPSM